MKFTVWLVSCLIAAINALQSPVSDTAYLVAGWRSISKLLPSEQAALSARLVGKERLKILHDKSISARELYGHANVDAVKEVVPVRHYWLNLEIRKHLERHPDCCQVVLLGAGLDVRAYYLRELSEVKVWEIDEQETMDYKENILREDKIVCKKLHRLPVHIDGNSHEWIKALANAGLDMRKPVIWIAEGLFYYLEESVCKHVLRTIAALPNSVVMGDMLGAGLKENNIAGDLIYSFKYGTDHPEELMRECGLEIKKLSQMGEWSCHYGVLDTTHMLQYWGFKHSRSKTHMPSGERIVRNFLFVASTQR